MKTYSCYGFLEKTDQLNFIDYLRFSFNLSSLTYYQEDSSADNSQKYNWKVT